MKNVLKIYYETLQKKDINFITLYKKLVNTKEGFLFETAENKKGGFSFVATSENKSIKTIEELKNFRNYLSNSILTNTLPLPFLGGAVGAFSYDFVREIENIPDNNEDILNLPLLHLFIINNFIAYNHISKELFIVSVQEDSEEGNSIANNYIQKTLNFISNTDLQNSIEYVENEKCSLISEPSKEEFIKKVNLAKEYICSGDIFQVVPSLRKVYEGNKDTLMLYKKLKNLNPSQYMYHINFGDYKLLGSSPELLAKIQNGYVYNCPIAGTRKIASSEKENLELEHDLLNDQKEIAEHSMLLDLARNDMGKVSEIGSVKISKFMEIHRYSHVMHIYSEVCGKKLENKDFLDVLSAFLPAGTLSGAPKIRAMEIIDELEDTKRGFYGGAVGYISYNQNMDTAITIRSIVEKNNKFHLQSGAGIVYDSVPENEFDECLNKMKILECVLKED